MAVHTATGGTVKVGGNSIGSIRSMSLETSAETIDATTITDTSKVNLAGTKSYSGSVDCYWDEADTNGQLVLIESDSASLEFGFEGSTSGDFIYTLATVVSGVSISSAVDGMVECSFSFTGTGPLTRGTV